MLFLCGTFLNGGLSHRWPDVRLSGVLNRIALAYFFTGLLFCYFKPRALVAICSGLLIGYWALMTFVPIRDIQLERSNLLKLAEQSGDKKTAELFAADNWVNPSAQKDSLAWAAAERMYYATTNRVTHKYGMGLNLSDHLDFKYLPGYKYEDFAEAEGLLSTLPVGGDLSAGGVCRSSLEESNCSGPSQGALIWSHSESRAWR